MHMRAQVDLHRWQRDARPVLNYIWGRLMAASKKMHEKQQKRQIFLFVLGHDITYALSVKIKFNPIKNS